MNPILARFLRAAVAVILAGLAQQYGDNPIYLGLVPLLMGIGKWLRRRYGWGWMIV